MIATIDHIPAGQAFSLLAQTQPAEKSGTPFGMEFFLLMAAIFVIFYMLIARPQRKRERERKGMLAALHKGDKIMTIGGVIGTVVGIKDNEVTVKVDEATNTKITFARSGIDRIVSARETPQESA